MSKLILSLLMVFLIPVMVGAQAKPDTSNTYKSLEEVVVTGQYKPQSLTKSVYQVRVINSDYIQLSGSTNIQQVLNEQLGFRFSTDNTLGITDVKLNGMGGNNVKILLDGVPMTDRYDQRVSLSQIDVHNIRQIEIVEGPMSVSYGSDAMAGVINIITKTDKTDHFSVRASAQEETSGKEYYPFSYKGVHNQHVGLNYRKGKIFVSLGGTHNDFDGVGGDEYGRGKSWKPKEQWLGNARLGLENERFNMYYRIDGMYENISSRNPINFNNYKATDQQYITNRFIHQLQGNYKVNPSLQLNGFLAYTDYSRETQTTRRNFLANTIEPNQAGENDLSKVNSLSFKTTLQYRLSDMVSLQPGIDINHEKAGGARIEGTPVINDYAAFVSAEIIPLPFANIRPGLRFSNNSEYRAPLAIPSLNTKFSLNDRFTLRLAYGYGFRAPTLRELYLTFFDANHSLVGNTGLKAESANSLNGSLTYSSPFKNATFQSTLTGFFNAYNNQIQLLQSLTDPSEYTYYNIDKSQTAGGAFENRLFIKNAEFTLGVSYVGFASSQFDDEDYVKEDNRNYLWTPEITSNIVYNIEKLKTKLALFYKFTGKKPAFSFGTVDSKDAILLTQTAAFNLADFTITTSVNKFLSTRLGVKNIFDITNVTNSTVTSSNSGHSGAGPLVVGYGRSFFLGLEFNWNHK